MAQAQKVQANKAGNKAKSAGSNNTTFIVIGVIAAAVLIAAVAILLSSNDTNLGPALDYSQIPQSRTADGGFVIGSPDAPVKIIAFKDFLCPHCQDYVPTTKEFIRQYVATGQAQFEYRFLPAVHPTYSVLAAQLAECSEILRPNSFWQAHDVLFELAASRRFDTNAARTFSEEMGFTYSAILDCQRNATQYQTDSQMATRYSVTGTPTVLVQYGNNPPILSQFGTRPNLQQLGQLVAAG